MGGWKSAGFIIETHPTDHLSLITAFSCDDVSKDKNRDLMG